MEFNFKTHKITKTKAYLKKNSLFFLFDGVYRDSNNWVLVEQSLKGICFNYWKICNRTAKKMLENSICRAIKPTIKGITFLMNPQNKWVSKQNVNTCFEALLFKMLAVKLNHKFYRTFQLKTSYSFQYRDSKILVFQFRIADLKKSSK